ncbi:acetylornithine transaminase [Halobacillus sp. BBL2006]|uniref:acetylornithine transaminase n=1 Tax=Halobacillus sp. BBL2006 TaxID=1543706 RepID=UPI000543886F|nr:acetylornithine transaminase [Halobacillus sp. BBL2006]KHE72672.1 acetylornithine aminotransferase [Halobacillus sp. BBL2006]
MSLFPTYNRFPLTIVSGSGTTVTDDEGNDYLDFVSGIAVCNLGHRPPEVQAAIQEQLDQVWHVSNLYQIPLQEEAANKLIEGNDLDHVFFCNSGAEANEAAIKLARKHTGKEKIITFKQSFHGRTFATMSATGQEKIQQGFGTLLPTFEYLPYNDVEAVEQIDDDEVAAIMVEVIQGEGGVVPGTAAFLNAIQKKCKETGILMVIDEVQTGMGRTGTAFAYEHYSLDPDIVTSAKGLGSGFPVGAMIGKAKLKEAFSAGAHGSTFGGNPLASAAVNATVETIFAPAFLEEVQRKGELFKEKLQESLGQLNIVKEVRGQGLMLGIQLEVEAIQVIHTLREKGLLAVLAGPKVVRLLPPLNVSEEELDKAVQIISTVLQQQDHLQSV